MIFEHEIPKGSRLYFGKTAKAKRVLENSVCEILEKNGFEWKIRRRNSKIF